MPFLPELPTWEKSVINTQQFLGLNRGLSIADGEMADMKNMSSDGYPVLSTRKPRGKPKMDYDAVITDVLSGNVDGMLGTDRLIVCHEGKVYLDGVEVPLELSTEAAMREKKLVSMGAYVCIWPDKVYFNINNPDDCGQMGASWEPIEGDEITAIMCRRDGTDYDMTQIVVSALAPEEPEDGDFWLDTSQETDVLRQYSVLYKEWVQVATTYIKIQAPGIGKNIKQGDTVWISGLKPTGSVAAAVAEEDGTPTAGTVTGTGKNVTLSSGYDVSTSGKLSTPTTSSDTQTISLAGIPEEAAVVKATLRFNAMKSVVQTARVCQVNGVNFTPGKTGSTHTIEIPITDVKKPSITFKFQINTDYASNEPGHSYGGFLEISNVSIEVTWEIIDHAEANKAELERLNTTNGIYAAGDDYIIVAGILHNALTLAHSLEVELKVPDLDYVCESNNRIWGCVYQEVDGTVVNELRCCALGDFRNWYKFQGSAADSYTVTLGSEGKFTGAFSYQGQPLFFKEGNIHKVAGTIPANYTINTIRGRGVQEGSWKSLAVVNETLFYKSRNDIMGFEGAMPYAVTQKLGSDMYQAAVGGGYRDKYYICMQDESLSWHTYVLDTTKGLWHQEGAEKITHMATAGGDLVLAIEGADSTTLRTVSSRNVAEEAFEWSVTFGILGFQSEQQKYLSRYNIRAQMSAGSHMKVEMQYDSDGKWHHMGTMKSPKLRTFLLPIIPRRCDHCQLRISGNGTINIYSVAREYENGGDG